MMLKLSFALIVCLNLVQCAPSAKLLDSLLDSSPAQSVHYAYGRHYDYGHTPQPYAYGGPPYLPHSYGHAHKHGYQHQGYHHNHGYEHGYEHLDHLPHPVPYAGYVPVYGPHGVHDHAHGYAYGHDLIGPFDHHTGPFGPFGFYANFYHD